MGQLQVGVLLVLGREDARAVFEAARGIYDVLDRENLSRALRPAKHGQGI